jgi:hypothetical protein
MSVRFRACHITKTIILAKLMMVRVGNSPEKAKVNILEVLMGVLVIKSKLDSIQGWNGLNSRPSKELKSKS